MRWWVILWFCNNKRKRCIVCLFRALFPLIFCCPPPTFRWTRGPCIAVDQFTSQPEYWQRAEELAAGKPSTLHIVLPEAYLGTPQEEERMQTIRRTMQEYRKSVLTRRVHGFVYVERTQMDGTIRQGLVGAVDPGSLRL